VDEILGHSRKRRWTKDYETQVIYSLGPHEEILLMKPETLRTRLKKIPKKKKKIKKGRPDYIEFMEQLFWSSDQPSPMDHDADAPVNIVHNDTHSPSVDIIVHSHDSPPLESIAPRTPEPVALPCTKATCSSSKELNTISYTIDKRNKHLAALEKTIKRKKETLSSHYSKKNVDRRDNRAGDSFSIKKKMKKELGDSTQEIEKCNKENKQLKARCIKEQEKKRKLQKECYRLRTALKNHRNCVGRARYSAKDKLCRKQARQIQDLQARLDEAKESNMLNVKDDGSGTYSLAMRFLVNELTSLEVAQSKIGPVIDAVATNLFNTSVRPLPSKTTVQNINDEGHFLVKSYIAENLKTSTGMGISTDGTQRKREKILDTTFVSSRGDTMSCGFTKVASETGQTIADVTVAQLKELALVSGEPENTFLVGLAEKLTFYMSDRASNEKKSHKIMDEWRRDMLRDTSEEQAPEVHKFYCMAHVLLSFHGNVLAELSTIQKTIQETEDLGRDKLDQFRNFRPDNVAQRVVRTTSDVFGPVGEHLGVRDMWLAHCSHLGIKSKIGSYKDNRFNALFENAAQILHHRKDFCYLLQFRCSNKKLQAVRGDLEDPIIITFIQSLAILFIQLTGPYWNLIDAGDVPYVNLQSVIQPLLEYCESCSIDPTPLYNPEGPDCLASYRGPASHLFLDLLAPIHPEHSDLLDSLLKVSCQGLVKTIKKQLENFLPGGIYGGAASEELISKTAFAHKTNLACEHHFGDLDSSQRKRPNCSYHHHSTVHMLKRNRIPIKGWLQTMPVEKREALWLRARKYAKELRESHRQAEKMEMMKLLEGEKTQSGKRTRNEAMEVDEVDEVSSELERLESLLPNKPTFATEQWIAVAYHDNWYPGIRSFYCNSAKQYANQSQFNKGQDPYYFNVNLVFIELVKKSTQLI
jgi:hypothetical protein